MNKHLFTAVLLLLSGCATTHEKLASLTVDLSDLRVGREVVLSGKDFNGSKVCDSTRVAEFEFPLEEGDYFMMNIGFSNNELYLEPGKPLNVKVVKNADGSFNLARLDLQFTGENADVNAYLNKRTLQWLADSDFLLDEEAYLEKARQYEEQNKETVHSWHLDKDFENKELTRNLYKLYEPLTRYPMQHYWEGGNDVFALWKQDDTPLVKKHIERLLVDDAELWKYEAYRKYVRGAIAIFAFSNFGIDWEKEALKRMEVAEKYFSTPVILEDLAQYTALIYVDRTQGAPLNGMQEVYDRYVKRQDYRTELENTYAAFSKVQRGAKMLSEGAVYSDIDGNIVKLEDLRGKYLYIDVWATWCGPCRQEIPHLKKLEAQFEGKNILFVSISIDSRSKDWAAMVEKEQLGGVQLFGGPKAQIAVDYGIDAIPRFLLFDRDGKLIDGDMSRPSDAKTKKILEELEGI